MADRNRNIPTGGRNRDLTTSNDDMMDDRDTDLREAGTRGQAGTRSPGARGSQGQRSAGSTRGSSSTPLRKKK